MVSINIYLPMLNWILTYHSFRVNKFRLIAARVAQVERQLSLVAQQPELLRHLFRLVSGANTRSVGENL